MAALATVVAVAAVDAVRNPDEDAPPAATTDELLGREEPARQLRRLGAQGELLLYGDNCRVRLLELPSLEQVGDDRSGCGPRGAVSPDGSAVARCLGDETEVGEAGGAGVAYSVRGCTPAWRPDGTLTVSSGRAVTRACPVDMSCRPVTLISRAELERAARRHPTSPARAPLRVLVDNVVWLSNARAAVLMSIRLAGRFAGMGPMAGIAFFESGRMTQTQPYFRVTGGRLGSSPRGTYVTQTPDVILRGDGSQVGLPQHLRDIRAFAWSPDERFLALAGRFAVTVVDVASLERYDRDGSGLRSVTLPVSALDLEWR